MSFASVSEMDESLKGVAEIKDGAVKIYDEAALPGKMDRLVYSAVHGSDEVKAAARQMIRRIADAAGVRLASIQGLYEAMGRGDVSGYTVPAINIRGLTYDTARSVFRAALSNDAQALIFEIAKSEIGYTEQRPDEYTVCILAAALREGIRGPVFIQGDHFQVNAKNFSADPTKETDALKALIKEAIEAGFYNIDIDASTTVDLSKPDVTEQQRPNFETTAVLTDYIRSLEPEGVTVSIGGEIGEVGKKNSTEEELRAFMDGYLGLLKEGGKGDVKGISKISVQTGTSHGGVPLPDGTIADVKVDFDTIEKLTRVSRDVYKISGVVQHGASTLPDDAFHHFPERGASEVHLATGFQNMIYDSEAMPADLKDAIYTHLKEKHGGEKKDGETDEQFIYKTRKKGFGPFKQKFWDLSEDIRGRMGKELEERFDYLFKKLKAVNTTKHMDFI